MGNLCGSSCCCCCENCRDEGDGSLNDNKRRNKKRTIQLELMGLDNAGKTHVMKLLTGEPPVDLTSSIGFSQRTFSYDKSFDISLFDLGGRDTIRSIWPQYLAECHGFIYVINVSEDDRIEVATGLLKDIATRDGAKGKPILVVFNRIPADFDEIAFVARLGLHDPPFNIDQRFHIAQMLTYNGYLDDQKRGVPFDKRLKRHTDQLLDTFHSFTEMIVSEFVSLDINVTEAKRALEERQKAERLAREERMKERERLEAERAAGIQETAIDGHVEAAAVAERMAAEAHVNPAFERDNVSNSLDMRQAVDSDAATIEAHSNPEVKADDDARSRLSSDVFIPNPSLASSALDQDVVGLPNHKTSDDIPGPDAQILAASVAQASANRHKPVSRRDTEGSVETGILGERSPVPSDPMREVPLRPVPAARTSKLNSRPGTASSDTTILVDSKTPLRFNRLERIQRGLAMSTASRISSTGEKYALPNGHINTAYLPEVT